MIAKVGYCFSVVVMLIMLAADIVSTKRVIQCNYILDCR